MSRRTPLAKSSERPPRPTPPPQEFGAVSDSSMLRQYPVAHYERRPLEFYPAKPERICGDILEIGPGRGDFLMSVARTHPEQRFVAVEVGLRRFAKLAARAEKHGLSNVLVIGGDARLVIPRHFDAASFGSVVVLFPDPWPKRRHAFNRLLQPEFLVQIARVLKPGGHLYLKSDVESYIVWVGEQIARLPQYRVVEDRWPWGQVGTEDGRTLSLFADRQTGLGYDIHSLCLERLP
jgi:tRNA (guanine-N7-)-methyltransferase